MATSAKESAVAELTDLFRESSAAVLTEYRGLTVTELKQLRDSIRQDATYAVAKSRRAFATLTGSPVTNAIAVGPDR